MGVPPAVPADWATTPSVSLFDADGCRAAAVGGGHVPDVTVTMHPDPARWVAGVLGFLAASILAGAALVLVRRAHGRPRSRSPLIVAIAAVVVVTTTAAIATGAETEVRLAGSFGGTAVTQPVWSTACICGLVALVLALGTVVVAASRRAGAASVH